MNKKDLINIVSEKTGLTKKESEKIFRSPIFNGVDPDHATEIFEQHGCCAVDFEV